MSLLETLNHPTPDVVERTIDSLYGIHGKLVNALALHGFESPERIKLSGDMSVTKDYIAAYIAETVAGADPDQRAAILEAAKHAILTKWTGSEKFCIEVLSSALIQVAASCDGVKLQAGKLIEGLEELTELTDHLV